MSSISGKTTDNVKSAELLRILTQDLVTMVNMDIVKENTGRKMKKRSRSKTEGKRKGNRVKGEGRKN